MTPPRDARSTGKSARKRESPSSRQDPDILDKLEDFIEEHVEPKLRKGLAEVEKFLKEELLERDRRPAGAGEAPPAEKDEKESPFTYIETLFKDRKVASVAPSSKFLVERVVKMVDWSRTRVIVEYGPATGVVTKELLKRLPKDGVLAAVELNDGFAATLEKTADPRLKVIRGSVLEVDRLLQPLGLPPADAVLSGIPFSYLKPIERHRLLHKTDDLLAPGGRFIAYQITAHLATLMNLHFEKVDVQYEIRNLPPNFIFTGFKA